MEPLQAMKRWQGKPHQSGITCLNQGESAVIVPVKSWKHDGGMGCSQGTFTTKYTHYRQAFIGSGKTKKGKSNRKEG